MEEIQFGKVAGSLILMVILGWVFTLISPDGDPANVDNRTKKTAAILAGIGLGVLGMFYASVNSGSPINLVSWVDYVLSGIIMGAGAIGFNQLTKKGK